MAHLQEIDDLLNLPGHQPLEFWSDSVVHRTGGGAQVVHLYQHCRGIPVFEAIRSVHMDARGAVTGVVGENFPLPFGLRLMPDLPANQAAAIAALHATEDWPASRRPSERPARTIARFPVPTQASVLKKTRIPGHISAHLVLFPLRGEVELGWQCTVAELPNESEHNVVVAAAGDHQGEVLYCNCTVPCVAARGRVFRTNPGDSDGARVDVDFPLASSEIPSFPGESVPPGFPHDWVHARKTLGNNVNSREGNGGALKGKKDQGTTVFEASPSNGHDQRVLNAFYFCNFLHDFFLPLGFNEAEQNFQKVNFTGAGRDGDELEVEEFGTKIDGGATMRSRFDGRSPVMRLGLVEPLDPQNSTAASRHGALDADVVFHEYVHGVLDRMVGGHLHVDPLTEPQSAALAEGWCDFFALSIQNFWRGGSDERTVLGAWVTNSAMGFRRTPYDEDFPTVATFANLGQVEAPGQLDFSERHNAGEIWAATLMSMLRAIEGALGSRAEAFRLCWALVVDSFKKMPAGQDRPSFLDARDATLEALSDRIAAGQLDPVSGQQCREAMLATFLRYGMGPQAQSPGAGFSGLQADFGS